MDRLKSPEKPFDISKWEVLEAYREVRSNQGAPGVDGQSIEDFEKDLKGNLYKIWNRMSSGSLLSTTSAAVEIPKPHGAGTGCLACPLLPTGLRRPWWPDISESKWTRFSTRTPMDTGLGGPALDAVETCRKRCWKRDWVIDLDIQKFFDSVRWDLIVKAVEVHTDAVWVKLYVQRWLQAPLQLPDGTLQNRDRGTPQGSAVSPVLANLFMHYAFDTWLARAYPGVQFERYADDAVVHCVSEHQAREVLAALGNRMEEVGLRLHPDKTRIVYCKDGKRRGSYEHTSFTFLGFTFQARKARSRYGVNFTNFLPAISKDALKKIGREVRSWRLHMRMHLTFFELARRINPIVRGWMQYYGAYYRSALHDLLRRINAYLMRWIRKKYRRLRKFKKAHACWKRVTRQYPRLFAHWAWTPGFW